MTSSFVLIFVTGGSASVEAHSQIAFNFTPQYPIIFLSHGQHDLSHTVRLVREAGGEATCLEIDSSANPTQELAKAVTTITEQFGDKCAAAIFQAPSSPPMPFLEQTTTGFRKAAVQPIASAYAFAQQAMPLLLNNTADGLGSPPTLIFVGPPSETSSDDAVVGNALVALSRSLGREFGKKGIHIAHIKYKAKSDGHASSVHLQIAATIRHLHMQPLSCFSNEMTI